MGAAVIAGTLTANVGVASSAPVDPPHPKQWDEQVQPFVRFVEKARGLEFEHPVKTRFLPSDEFDRALVEGEEPVDEALDAQLSGELVALGLAAERTESGDGYDDASVAVTYGFYDQETEELVVRGTDVDDIDVRTTLVHELTHALQDQHFDLDALDETTQDDSEYYTLTFLVEGDATAIETAYLDTLSPEEQDAYYESAPDGSEPDVVEGDADSGAGYPYVLDLVDDAPYFLGEAYVAALDPDGGTKGRDLAFAHPPKTEEVLLDPVALDRHERAMKVPDPALLPGEVQQYDPEQFGVVTLYLTLAPRLGARTALEAVTGWGGDRYVGFQRGSQACLRTNVTGDRAADTDELEAALVAWQATMPAGAVEVARTDDVVTFTACEVAGVEPPTVEQLDSAFYNVLGGRVFTILDLVTADLSLRAARCVGDHVSTDPGSIAVYDASFAEDRDLTSKEERVVDRAYDRAIEACASVLDPGGSSP